MLKKTFNAKDPHGYLAGGWKLYECPILEVAYLLSVVLRVHIVLIEPGPRGGWYGFYPQDANPEIEHTHSEHSFNRVKDYLALDREIRPLPEPILKFLKDGSIV